MSTGLPDSGIGGPASVAHPLRTGAVVFLLASSLAVAAFPLLTGRISTTIVARGRFVPSLGILEIRSLRPGRIASVLVREGQIVQRGQTLARIDAGEADMLGGSSQGAALESFGQQRSALDEQSRLARLKEASELSEHREQLKSLKREIADLDQQIESQREVVELHAAEAKTTAEVAERGFVSRRELNLQREGYLSSKQQLAALDQTRASRTGELLQLVKGFAGRSAGNLATMAQLSFDRAQLSAQRAKAEYDRGSSLTAPSEGRVSNIMVHAGSKLESQDVLMVVIPIGSRMTAELYLPNASVGFIRAGQHVELALDAFPQTRYGSMSATLAWISGAPAAETGTGVSPDVYRAVAVPDQQYLYVDGERRSPRVGMTLRARIITDRRSILAWIAETLFPRLG